jgi:hypothetical protein
MNGSSKKWWQVARNITQSIRHFNILLQMHLLKGEKKFNAKQVKQFDSENYNEYE